MSVNWVEFVKLLSKKLINQHNEEKITSVLKKLDAVPMSLDILKETKIGKIVNDHRKSDNSIIADFSKRLVKKWKDIASAESSQQGQILVSKTEKHNQPNSVNIRDSDHDIYNPIDIHQKSLTIQTPYIPTPINQSLTLSDPKQYNLNSKNGIDTNIQDFYLQKSKTRTQIYSGKRKNITINHQFGLNKGVICQDDRIPTLYSMCIQTLIQNIDSIECIGAIPVEIIAPVLAKCSPMQLYNLENFNPKLIDDTDTYWERHSFREFKPAHQKRMQRLEKKTSHKSLQNKRVKYNGQDTQQNQSDNDDDSFDDDDEGSVSWREFYLTQMDERDARLQKITANITASMARSTPGPRVKLAFMSGQAKPPRNVLRKQLLNCTTAPGLKPLSQTSIKPLNNGLTAQLNGKAINNNAMNQFANSNSMSGSSIRISDLEVDPEKYVVPKVSALGTNVATKKVAPIMNKTLKLFKRYQTRR